MAEPSDRPATDVSLVLRARAGELSAYGELVRRYETIVWHIALQTLLDRGTCENLVQQVFLNAFEHLHSFDVERDFGVWLRSVARNLARDELRRLSRQRHLLPGYQDHLLMLLAEPTTTDGAAGEPERQADARRRQEALRRCQEGLAPAAGQAIALRYQQGLPLTGVADRLGRSVTATRQLLFRTRMALRDCIQQQLATQEGARS